MKGVVAALMMVGVVACTVTDSPPQDLVTKNDHAGLETWYVKEAAHLRKRTKNIIAMADLCISSGAVGVSPVGRMNPDTVSTSDRRP